MASNLVKTDQLKYALIVNNKGGNGGNRGDRIALAPIDIGCHENAVKVKKQPLGIHKKNEKSSTQQDSNQASKLAPKSTLIKASKTSKGPGFEIFLDDDAEEEKQHKAEPKQVKTVVKEDGKENKPELKEVKQPSTAPPPTASDGAKDDLNPVDMLLEDESDKEKESEESLSSQSSKSESVIALNALSIEESRKDSDASPSEEQVANIMSMLGDAESKSRLFEELLLETCKEYSDEIHSYLLECETKFQPDDYMPKQQDINTRMRSILVDWLAEVAEEYRLNDETLFLSVNFIDRFLSNMTISRQSLQLLGTASLFIASKYEEIYPPDINDFVYITDDSYNKQQVLSMEKLILKVLQFDISTPTSCYFLRKYLSSSHLPKCISHMAQYFCYLTLLEDNPFFKFYPSEVALCSIILAAYTCDVKDLDLSFYKHSHKKYAMHAKEADTLTESINSLQLCLTAIYNMHKFAPMHAQQFIREKFSREKYLRVAQTKHKESPPDIKHFFK